MFSIDFDVLCGPSIPDCAARGCSLVPLNDRGQGSFAHVREQGAGSRVEEAGASPESVTP